MPHVHSIKKTRVMGLTDSSSKCCPTCGEDLLLLPLLMAFVFAILATIAMCSRKAGLNGPNYSSGCFQVAGVFVCFIDTFRMLFVVGT